MKHYDEKQMQENILYLEALSEQYPNIQSAAAEMINLHAILDLPKGTEHFLSDIHGEHEAFRHILNNASGSIREKIDDLFSNTLTSEQRAELATLIYYPKEKLSVYKSEITDIEEWYRLTLIRLLAICRHISSKYTRSKVRKTLPKHYAYIIEELMFGDSGKKDRETYHENILHTIIEAGQADVFILSLCDTIKRLIVDKLHIVGDIFDRGARPDIVLDDLMMHHGVDIQWGNHDVVWMGAAAGQRGCIVNVIRICARYGNLDILEDGYGINLLPLATYAMRVYGDDPCSCFKLKGATDTAATDSEEMQMNLRIHKAISVLQFKIEGQIIQRRPEFHLEERAMLHRINYEKGTITLEGKEYPLSDTNFPTIDPEDPYRLTPEEEEIMNRLEHAFANCEKLQQHMRFLLTKGGLYKVYNDNLLYHGCVPLNEDGSLKDVEIYGKTYRGRELYDVLDSYVRKGFFALDENERQAGKDIMWFIWLHPDSPLFGKNKMATFERCFLADSETHVEKKNPYYFLIENEKVIDGILREFGLDPEKAHIVNGHVPVKRKDGESPIKCGGKVMVIDGGFSKAYQKETGIAGYTLIYNSYGLRLVAHEPFESTEAAIAKENDIHSETMVVQRVYDRYLVGDTDAGREQIADLERLLAAYRNGEITEKI